MNILILGGGGREHALAWAFAQNPKCDRLWCAPGNAGIAEEATCVALDILDGDKVLAFARENAIDFVMVGPEAPLAEGVADVLRAGGIPTFGAGPRGGAARGVQGLHQGDLRRLRRADRRQPDLHRPARPPAPTSRPRARRSWSRPTASPPARA